MTLVILAFSFSKITWFYSIAAKRVVVGQSNVCAHFTGKFKRALAIARVLVPVAVRSKETAVFFLRARLYDAFAAILIERVVLSTILCLENAHTRAGTRIPLFISVAIDELAAFFVKLRV